MNTKFFKSLLVKAAVVAFCMTLISCDKDDGITFQNNFIHFDLRNVIGTVDGQCDESVFWVC